jgi:phage virion morphogenesis protein
MASLIIDTRSLEGAFSRLITASSKIKDKIPDFVGQLIETQTRNRLQNEKTDPDGKAWAPWSTSYAKSRHKGHSLLQNTGHLLDSITYVTNNDGTVEVGSNLNYADDHQNGNSKRRVPARPYLGLSNDNLKEIAEEIGNYLDRMMR